MAGRMESTEIRQQQMMAFLARAVNNPAFLQQLLSARQTQRSLDNRGAFSCLLDFCALLQMSVQMLAWAQPHLFNGARHILAQSCPDSVM